MGTSFTKSYPDWESGTKESFIEWATKQFGLKDLDSDDDVEVPVHFKKAREIEFQKNKQGEYVLPPMSDFKTIRQKQRIVRGYIGAVYRA